MCALGDAMAAARELRSHRPDESLVWMHAPHAEIAQSPAVNRARVRRPGTNIRSVGSGRHYASGRATDAGTAKHPAAHRRHRDDDTDSSPEAVQGAGAACRYLRTAMSMSPRRKCMVFRPSAFENASTSAAVGPRRSRYSA